MIILIDNYDSFTFNLYHLLKNFENDVQIFRNNKITLHKIKHLNPSAIVLSPGPKRPEDAGILLSILEYFIGKTPLLGVCLGHQALGMVLGARVISAPKILHGKPSLIFHHGNLLYKNIPSPFLSARYHSLCLDPQTISKEITIDAKSEDDTIMGISVPSQMAYGIQYHPESILTKEGVLLIKNFMEIAKKPKRHFGL